MEYRLPGPAGYPSAEVAGENSRTSEIIAAIGGKPKLNQEVEVELDAVLIPEPDNPFDRNAISVRIKGHSVGYIPKEDTGKYRDAINRIAASGHVATTKARVWAVTREDYDGKKKFYSRVSLVLPWDGLKLPINNPPASPHVVLPWGGALQVTGEDQHFDVLRNFLTPDGDGLAFVTLHKIENTLKNGTVRELVEVRIDGQRIGEMTTTTSKHFLPVIAHVDQSGQQLAAWAKVKGSPVSVEVALQGARANEVPAAWFSGEGANVPSLIPPAATYAVPPAYIGQPEAPRSAAAKPVQAASRSGKLQAHAPMEKAKGGCAAVVVLIGLVGASVSGIASLMA